MTTRLRPLLSVFILAALGCGGDDGPDDPLHEQQSQKGWGAQHCPAPPPEIAVGYQQFQQLGEIPLKTCNGDNVTLADVCGADAAWLYFVHMWCPNCRALGDMAESIHDSFEGQNLASVNVIVENSSGHPPDEDDCSSWRDTFDQEDVITLFDPEGKSFVLWNEAYTSLNVTLDSRRVIMGKFHSSRDRDVLASIGARLAEAVTP